MTALATPEPNATRIVAFARSVARADIPAPALDAARMAVADWYGVALGATGEPAVAALHRAVALWAAPGRAPVLTGGKLAAAPAALLNGTAAHCLDFDDTHVGSIAHLSGPAWAAAWAVGTETGASAEACLRAYLAGFETGARLGNGGFGVAVNERRTHSTGVFGCFAAATAAAVLLDLSDAQFESALGLAATQVGGLTESFGTPAKPFHAGKAAFNGVFSAQMAQEGFEGAPALIDPDGGLARALVQDGAHRPLEFDGSTELWEIRQNTLKPYAACLLTHPTIDACRSLHDRYANSLRQASDVELRVNPLAIQIAGIEHPATPYQGKFSLAFCAALGLTGHVARQQDFNPDTLGDETIRHLVAVTRLAPDPEMDLRASTVRVDAGEAGLIEVHTPLALGNPGNPMSWSDMEDKFTSLATPAVGEAAAPLFTLLRQLGTGDGPLPAPPDPAATAA